MGIVLGLFFALCAHGAKVSYPEQKLNARGIEKIQIAGVKGRVKLTGHEGRQYRLKVRHSKGRKFEDWSLLVDRRGSTLILEVSSAIHGAQWRKVVRKEDWPEFDIEIKGPPKPAMVSWRDGEIVMQKWSASVDTSQLSGRVAVRDSVGNFRIEAAASDVEIANVVGDVDIKGEAGKVSVKGLKGDLTLAWVRGPVDLHGVQGVGRVEINNSHLTLKACHGNWHLNVSSGQVEIERCAGKLEAEGKTTRWRLMASSSLETEIKSLSGDVFVNWQTGGAKVFLASDTGAIHGQKLKAFRDSEGRRVADFMIKGPAMGQVFVRTESGAIQFKQ